MKKRHQVLAFLFSLSTITYIDRTSISLLASDMKADLHIQNDAWGWILSAFALSYALFELPTGTLGDRMGPRRILTRVVTWWSVFTAFTGMATSWLSLLVVRFFFGAGEAGAYPNASIVVSRWFPKQEIGRAQSFIWAAGRIGGSLAPWLVIPIAAHFGWRICFYALGLMGIAWAGIWYLWFRDFPHEMRGVSPEELAQIEKNQRFKAINHHIPWKKLLRSKNVWALVLMFHFYMYGAYFFTGWLPTYLKEGRHFDKTQMQWFSTLPFLLGTIGCLTGGFTSDWLSKRYGLRLGRRVVGITGLGLSSLVIFLSAMTTDNQMAAILLAMGMGFKDLTLPVSFAVCIDIGKSRSGMVTGAMNMIGQMGAVFIGVIFGYIVQSTGNFNLPLYLIAFLLLCSCLLWLRIDPLEEVEI
jgi:ACS family glucarate transporter-like MFS transporter